jgi:BlaI family transcriptional regulator, penicillinase repressor
MPPSITEAEWKVMRQLWGKAPLPAYDLIQALGAKEKWHSNTVKTLLTRLTRKKALGARKYKNLFLYYPLVTEEECIQAESDSLVERLFDGAVQPLLLHFARRRKFTKKDLIELRKILDGKEKE